MADVVVWEAANQLSETVQLGGERTGSKLSRMWHAIGSDDQVEIVIAVLAEAEVSYTNSEGDILLRDSIDPKPKGPGKWEVTVEWTAENDKKNDRKPAANTWSFDFDTSGGTHKIFQAIAESCSIQRKDSEADPDEDAPNVEGAIGWDGKKVNGVEIVVPKLEFSIHAYYDPSEVDTVLMADIARSTGKVNSDEWLGFDPGEVLFLGGSGSGDIPSTNGQRVKPIKITYKFAASENIPSAVVVSPNMELPCEKPGWDYLDVYYEKHADAGEILARAKWARIYQIYDRMDFGDFFGFGT